MTYQEGGEMTEAISGLQKATDDLVPVNAKQELIISEIQTLLKTLAETWEPYQEDVNGKTVDYGEDMRDDK